MDKVEFLKDWLEINKDFLDDDDETLDFIKEWIKEEKVKKNYDGEVDSLIWNWLLSLEADEVSVEECFEGIMNLEE